MAEVNGVEAWDQVRLSGAGQVLPLALNAGSGSGRGRGVKGAVQDGSLFPLVLVWHGLALALYARQEDYFVTADQLWVPLRWVAPELIDEVHGNLLIVDQTKTSNIWWGETRVDKMKEGSLGEPGEKNSVWFIGHHP